MPYIAQPNEPFDCLLFLSNKIKPHADQLSPKKICLFPLFPIHRRGNPKCDFKRCAAPPRYEAKGGETEICVKHIILTYGDALLCL